MLNQQLLGFSSQMQQELAMDMVDYVCDDIMQMTGCPSADCVLTPDGGAVRFEIPENGMAFVTTDYVERVPTPVKDVKVADGRLTWTPVDDPDHCYYRVYANGRQIASTVATSLPVKTDDVSSLTVKSVDKWGNEGR